MLPGLGEAHSVNKLTTAQIRFSFQVQNAVPEECLPVDEILATSHIRSLIREEKDSHTGHFVRFCEALQRDALGLILPDLWIHVARLIGIHCRIDIQLVHSDFDYG